MAVSNRPISQPFFHLTTQKTDSSPIKNEYVVSSADNLSKETKADLEEGEEPDT
jgi:hypothetical protein